MTNRTRSDQQERIVQDPSIMAGKPIVRGTRIPVKRVLQHLDDTQDLDDLFAAFPHLSEQDVLACLRFDPHRSSVRQALFARVLKIAQRNAERDPLLSSDDILEEL